MRKLGGIVTKKNKKLRKNFKKKIILIVLILLFCLIIFGCFYTIYTKTIDVKEENINEKSEEQTDEIIGELVDLNKKNEDVIGWIKIDNSKINYPVLYSGDDYYLRRDYNKDYKREGSIYIDKYNSLTDINLIIHGHNLDTGTMFTDLLKYKEESYYKKHKTIDFYTISDGHMKYEVIAVFLSKVYEKDDDVFKYYKYYGDLTEKEYDEYIKNIKDLSLYDIDVDTQYPTDLITLSTCEFSTDNGRMVVVAKKVES